MTENSQDRRCVSRAARGGTTSITAKTIAGSRIGSTEPCSGGNRQSLHLRDFRCTAIFEVFNTICPRTDITAKSIRGFSSPTPTFAAPARCERAEDTLRDSRTSVRSGARMPKSARCTTNGGERKTITSLNSRATRASCNRSAYPPSQYAQAARGQTRFRSYGRSAHRASPPRGHGRLVARITPVVPYIRLDSGALSFAKSARLSAALHGQLTFKNSETLNECGMAVFADDARPDKRE